MTIYLDMAYNFWILNLIDDSLIGYGLYFLIIETSLMIVWLDMAHNFWILNLIDDNVIGMTGKHIIAII